MQTFIEFLADKHPEALDEGWRDWAKKAVIGGTLAAGACGIGGCSAPNYDQMIQQQYQMSPQEVEHMKTKMPHQYQNMVKSIQAMSQADGGVDQAGKAYKSFQNMNPNDY